MKTLLLGHSFDYSITMEGRKEAVSTVKADMTELARIVARIRYSLSIIVHRVLPVLLIIGALIAGISANAEAVYSLDIYDYIVQLDGTAKIINVRGMDEELDIPSTLDEYEVTAIGDNAFGYCTELVRVSIPDSLTRIDANPFATCHQLEHIEVSSDHPRLAVVDNVLFDKDRHRLVCAPKIGMPKEYVIPGNTEEIGDGAFYACWHLRQVTLPESVTFIGDDAFASCALKEVILPRHLTHIGDGAFSQNVMETLDLPENVVSVGRSAFGQCLHLAKVSIPLNVTDFPDNPFVGCENLRSLTLADGHPTLELTEGMLIHKPDSRLISWPGAYNSDVIIIPEDIEIIGDGAFDGYFNLEEITVPQGVKRIGDRAFNGTFLSEVTLPESIIEIGDEAFAGCYELQSIELPDTLTKLSDGLFSSCDCLESIEIPSGVTEIGECTFDRCINMEEITLPETLGCIGDRAFYYCTGLSSLYLPKSVVAIGKNSFYGCENLTLLVEPGSYAESFCIDNDLKYRTMT